MKCFTMRLKEMEYEKIRFIAEKQDRSMTKQIENVLKRFIEDFEKVNGVIELSEVKASK